jgi:hypothetical protein
MKSKLLLSALFSIIIYSFSAAQNNTRCYAITGRENNNFFWADIQQVDMTNGKIIKTVFETNKTPFKLRNGGNNTSEVQRKESVPTVMGVAACALDPTHNRLYFSPMHFSDIHYLDLDQPDINFTTIKTNAIPSRTNEGYLPEEDQITRMVISSNGDGYALSNDANHLIRFSTGNKGRVEDMGSLIDAGSNKEISIHDKLSSWGGDMIADAFGNLVIVAASHNVFTVDLKTRLAKFKGAIKGLPANFTTNGAAVDNNGYLVVSSANIFDALYKVNMEDLSATKIISEQKPFNASDLASGNFLFQKEADAANNSPLLNSSLTTISEEAKIFPNPLSGSEFKVLLGAQRPGRYTVRLTDLAGRTILSKTINITKSIKTATVNLGLQQAKGTFLVNITSTGGQMVLSEKILIE